MTFNADSKVGEMLADPAASQVLLKHLPGLGTPGPMTAMARALSLTAIARFPQANITPEKLKTIVDELATL